MKDVLSSAGAVVAADRYAAKAGADILRRGGNAVDAAVAALLVECIVQPHNVGLGGYAGTMVVYCAEKRRVFAIDFDSRAPMAAVPDMFPLHACTNNWDVESDGSSVTPGINEHGYMCVTAPPIVAGLALALERFGRMQFGDVAAAAQGLAENGFEVSPTLAKVLGFFVTHADADSVHALLPGGNPPRVGELFVQKDMAALIGRLRTHGPEVFYNSDIPQTISDCVRRHGGALDEIDFRIVEPRIEEPLRISIGDFDICTPAPPAGGLTALQILKAASMAGLTDTDLCSPRHFDAMIKAARHAWADRFAHLADPLFVDIPVDMLLSDTHIAGMLGRAASHIPAAAGSGEHTIHLTTADSNHNMVSLTATHGSWFGSMVAVEGLGLVMGNGMSRFDPLPNQPNSVAPGKRVQHNMTPLVITRNGAPYCAIGLPGGRKIVNVAALLAHGLTCFGLTCGEAIDLPRFHLESDSPARIDCKNTVAAMKREFGDDYPIELAQSRLGGPVAGIMLAQETEQLLSASEVGPECVDLV